MLAPGQILAARVVFWQPPGPDGGGDIAGLELDGNLPFGAAPARWRARATGEGIASALWASPMGTPTASMPPACCA
ncbi:MAG TPA: hypothetical protein VF909_19550, partial [Roseiflexaceae bacterium]